MTRAIAMRGVLAESIFCSADLVGLLVRSDARLAGLCRGLNNASRHAVDVAFPPLELSAAQSIAFVVLPQRITALWNIRAFRFRGAVRERMVLAMRSRYGEEASAVGLRTVDVSSSDVASLAAFVLNPLFRRTREFIADMTAIRSLAPLLRMTLLEVIECKGCQRVASVRFTGALRNLHTLNVAYTRVRSLEGLPKSITDLNISYTPVDDLRPLATLPLLRHLNMEWTYRVFSIGPLLRHPSIRTLNLSWSKIVYVSDVVEIANLCELTVLGILPSEMTRIRMARPDLKLYF